MGRDLSLAPEEIGELSTLLKDEITLEQSQIDKVCQIVSLVLLLWPTINGLYVPN